MTASHGVRLEATERHLVFASGGTRAFLNGAGAIFAFHLAGLNNWASVGGVSGGSIPALLLAAGIAPHDIVRAAVYTNFSELFEQTDSMKNMIRSRSVPRSQRQKYREGIFRSGEFGQRMEEVADNWPEKFWTMAVCGNRQLLFTAAGVHLYKRDRSRLIRKTAPPVGLAMRATCAVPGIIEAVEYDSRILFDGALSHYGDCPTDLVVRHFGAKAAAVVAVDLMRDRTCFNKFVEMVGRLLSGTLRERKDEKKLVRAGLTVSTFMDNFNSLDFNISVERKQQAVLVAFQTTCQELLAADLLSEDLFVELLESSQSWGSFEKLMGGCTEDGIVQVPRHRRWYQLWHR